MARHVRPSSGGTDLLRGGAVRASVLAAAKPFQTRFESRSGRMYVDAIGKVTTGIGNLIDSVADAQRHPWQKACPGGKRLATPDEIAAEWTTVKSRQDLRGAPLSKREAITTLWLEDEAIDALFDSETNRMWSQIVSGYPDAETWPAPAQLATLSMCWAEGAGHILPGPSFDYPHWRAAALAQDWASCASECFMQGVGIDGRNKANRALFLAAAEGGDPDVIPSI